MNSHTTYKDSPARWLGKVPTHWTFMRGKYLYLKEQRSVSETDEVVTCFRDGTVTLRKNRRTTGFTESFKEIGYQGIRKGDLVIHVMDAFAGSIGVSDSDGKGTPVYSVCTAKGNSNNYYYAYLLREMARAGFIQSLYRGIRERSSDFRFEVFGAQFYPVPPRAEQDQIVRFLDWKVSEINKLIASKRKQISLIQEYRTTMINNAVTRGIQDSRLKASGMNWLPQIPANWETIPAKALFDHVVELRHEQDEMLAATQKYGMIAQKEYMELEERRIVLANDNLDKWLHVEPDDFIISLRSFQGGLEVCTMPGCVTWHYVVLRPKENVYVPYFKWLFKSASYIGALQRTSDFIRDGQDLRFSNFIKVRLLLVPLDEQREIAEYLDKKIPLFDVAEKKISDEIAALQEIKARLISDVVTGKMDVRGIEVPEYEPVTEETEPADEDSTEEEPTEDQED